MARESADSVLAATRRSEQACALQAARHAATLVAGQADTDATAADVVAASAGAPLPQARPRTADAVSSAGALMASTALTAAAAEAKKAGVSAAPCAGDVAMPTRRAPLVAAGPKMSCSS